MSKVLQSLVFAATEAGIVTPIGVADLRDWLLRTVQFFDEERSRFGKAPEYDCLIRDWVQPGMYVVVRIRPESLRLTAGRVDEEAKQRLRLLIDGWPSTDTDGLLKEIESVCGRPFWVETLSPSSLQ